MPSATTMRVTSDASRLARAKAHFAARSPRSVPSTPTRILLMESPLSSGFRCFDTSTMPLRGRCDASRRLAMVEKRNSLTMRWLRCGFPRNALPAFTKTAASTSLRPSMGSAVQCDKRLFAMWLGCCKRITKQHGRSVCEAVERAVSPAVSISPCQTLNEKAGS